MTQILVHELPGRAQQLLAQFREALYGVDDAAALIGRAHQDNHRESRFVFTGQYNAGKSTLIKALTDATADVTIGADIATDRVTDYRWGDSVLLTDTPGVKAGIAVHDELAHAAITAADFVLFVVTVDLFDDVLTEYIRYVAWECGKFDQMIVVLTHASTMAGDAAMRQRALAHAFGREASAPSLVVCDSVEYLRSLAGGPPELRALSNLDAVRAAINDMSALNGHVARLRQPFQHVVTLCDEAVEVLIDDPARKSALALLNRQRSALHRSQGLIDSHLDLAQHDFVQRCRSAAYAFADRCEEIAESGGGQQDLERAKDEVRDQLNALADDLGKSAEEAVSRDVKKLSDELDEIDESRRAIDLRALLSDIDSGRPAFESDFRTPPPPGAPATTPLWMRSFAGWLGQAHEYWGAGGGVRAASGTLGYDVVKRIGGKLGYKFKPWESARIANNLGKSLGAAAASLQAVASVAGVVLDEQQRVKQERARQRSRNIAVNDVTGLARDIAHETRTAVTDNVYPELDNMLRSIDALADEISAEQQTTDDRRQAIDEIRAHARHCLADLARAMELTQPSHQPSDRIGGTPRMPTAR